MQRRDIIRRAFRGTGVGIDIDGKMKNFLRFPGFETYVPPEKEEDHIDEVLTEKEIQKLEMRMSKGLRGQHFQLGSIICGAFFFLSMLQSKDK